MKKFIVLFLLYFAAYNYVELQAQECQQDSLMELVNPYLKSNKKKHKRILKIFYKKYKNNSNNTYAIEFNKLSLKEKKCELYIYEIYTILDIDDNKNSMVGYLKINNEVVLIYSDSCKKELINEAKILTLDNEAMNELEFKYPRYTKLIDQITYYSSVDPTWLKIYFKNRKAKIIDKSF